MKFNQWTLGLAAVGVVSLASAAVAEEKMNVVQTAITGTTISGYVDTSMQWNFGTGNAIMPPYKFNSYEKADGFNLDVVQLSISKPLDETEWASGYKVDLWFGPDADWLDTGYSGGDVAIRQAYVALRTPVGNGIEWKVGVFDTIIGYESLESGNNPNYTRSYGNTIEPQTHTGVLATYRFNDCIAAAVGVANTIGPEINGRAFDPYNGYYNEGMAESYKTYMGSIALTAPQSWGWAAGSTLYGGVVNGFAGSDYYDGDYYNVNTTSWYLGGTLATPVAGLKFGAAFDYLDVHDSDANVWAVAGYASYQATEKLSLHLRGEYVETKDVPYMGYFDYSEDGYADVKIFALTGTVQYDLWKNVISRLEVRWDHSCNGEPMFGGEEEYNGNYYYTGLKKNVVMLAANIIYKF